MSFDASLKLHRGRVRGWLRHTGRDVDRKNGCEVNHSNPNIDADLTVDNVTYVYDAEKDDYKLAGSVAQIDKVVSDRLKDVEKPFRKDAVTARPLILQLDPVWYEEHAKDEWGDSYDAMFDWAVQVFGKKNIAAVSVHEDEVSPHMHLLFVPVTKDGRLSQKDWFRDPLSLKQMHQDLRQHMRDRGYDVDLKNRKPGKYAKRMTEAEYRDFAQLQETADKTNAKQKAVDRRERDIKRREAAVSRKEADLQKIEELQIAREKRLNDREAALTAKEAALEKRQAELDQDRAAFDTRVGRYDRRTKSATKISSNVARRVPDVGLDFD